MKHKAAKVADATTHDERNVHSVREKKGGNKERVIGLQWIRMAFGRHMLPT